MFVWFCSAQMIGNPPSPTQHVHWMYVWVMSERWLHVRRRKPRVVRAPQAVSNLDTVVNADTVVNPQMHACMQVRCEGSHLILLLGSAANLRRLPKGLRAVVP